jgi:hypothetical protein
VPCVDGSPLARVLFDGDARLVGAAMCPAYWCGTTWPLAIMLSAEVPVKTTHSGDALAQVGCPDAGSTGIRIYVAVAAVISITSSRQRSCYTCWNRRRRFP